MKSHQPSLFDTLPEKARQKQPDLFDESPSVPATPAVLPQDEQTPPPRVIAPQDEGERATWYDALEGYVGAWKR